MLYKYISSTFSLLMAACFLLAAGSEPLSAETAECHVGSYRLADGRIVDIAPLDSDRLRWRTFDGEVGELKPSHGDGWQSLYGWTGRPDGIEVKLGSCDDGHIRFAGSDGQRLHFDVDETDFAVSGGGNAQGAAGDAERR